VADPILLTTNSFCKAHFDIGAKRDVAQRGRRASPPNTTINTSAEAMIYRGLTLNGTVNK
jgi:hypothetical protein